MSRIAILGSGAWGTAIALSLHRRGGHQIILWAHTPELAHQILDAGENTQFLPGFPIPPAIAVTADCAAITAADILVSAIPSEFLRPTLLRIRTHLRNGQIVLSATKGVEDRTFLRMTEVLADCLGQQQSSRQGTTRPPLGLVPQPDGENSGASAPVALTPPAPLTPLSSPSSLVPSPCLPPIGALSGPSFALEVA